MYKVDASKLKALMRQKVLSQCDLAKATGLAQPTISAILHGTRSRANTTVIHTLAKFFKVKPYDLLEG